MKNTTHFSGLFVTIFALFAVVTLVTPTFVFAFATLPYFEFGSGSASGGSYNYGNSTNGGTSYVAQSLSVSCSPIPTSARVGDSILWFASIRGGSGGYQYFWSGTDGLTGNASSARFSYSSAGTKYGTVTVVSEGQAVTVGCTDPVVISYGRNDNISSQTPSTSGFGISCYPADEKILTGESGTWLAVTSGLPATGTITYTWDGTDGLTGTGPMAFKAYTTNGRKFAILTVTSGGKKATSACTSSISVAPYVAPVVRTLAVAPVATPVVIFDPIQGVCSANVEEIEVGKEVIWEATVVGGTGTYRFAWQGDEDLAGTATSTSKTYEDIGEKTAGVTVTSGTQEEFIFCASPLTVVPLGGGILAGIGSFVFGNPFLLILAALLATIIGIYLAMRKRRQEEDEDAEKAEAKH
ncbi:MAG: hypothetical protein COV91_03725 [Candidatus Taylorbacteria bacterium CG11_big_fil_rev_8_21_14_0_20_46_11]|uniref:PKD domain-containing protein n=1 Tax=Candidatus Taylorbacteria bacterium CG11_big_fil_rev_8_21_14_0_20_46_11 TaxID=1975025 RepID=A0A2H0KBE9_9BACT|nr:MAG: hypothetical protein COV91_03725 [Candidatus Taylorbacteria bacterium CG11_big_fil_rev_8_21_14_0_20_46_11]